MPAALPTLLALASAGLALCLAWWVRGLRRDLADAEQAAGELALKCNDLTDQLERARVKYELLKTERNHLRTAGSVERPVREGIDEVLDLLRRALALPPRNGTAQGRTPTAMVRTGQ